MLGKLTKHAFKSNASSVAGIYFAMGIMSAIMLVLLFVDWTKWGETGLGIGLFIKIASSAVLCITAAIAVILTLVKVFSDFSENMFGKEGHLTMTLPVRSSSLFLSKWISGSFWVLLSYAVLCLSALGSFLYIIKHSLGLVQGNEAYYSVYELAVQMLEQLCASAGIATPSAAVLLNLASLYAFSGAVRACVFVLLVFFAITLSHCRPFNRLGKIAPLVYFFLSYFVVSTFAGVITKLIKIYIVVSEDAYTFTLSAREVAAAWDAGFGAFSITNIYCTFIAAVFVFLMAVILIDRRVDID